MNILIIGSGGREHALAWKAAQSNEVQQVYVAPGNPGTAIETKVTNVAISPDNFPGLIEFAKTHAIDLTIVGPEAPLSKGIVDSFTHENLLCFGPSQAAAQLEASKEFAKDFMVEHNIATARYQSFSDVNAAKNYVRQQALPIVIKADGLAAGKGVVIAHTLQHADQTIESMLSGNQFGTAGHRIVIEEFLVGEEASFIVISDGKRCLPLASSQDHKARDDNDKGPNTGGMGAYSPAPVVTAEIENQVLQQIIQPVIDGMAAKGTPFVGFLYAGLMIDDAGQARVVEFNCRLGDPEAEVLLLRLNSDLVKLCLAALNQQLNSHSLEWDSRPALGVVLASKGYPETFEKGFPIYGLEKTLPDCKIFHSGTALENNHVVNQGGRVLCVCALSDTYAQAQHLAYQQVQQIQSDALFYRTDIGFRAINRQTI